jgi:succinate dehydrogenase/fumarate reductase flavoprotein subunit
VFYVVFDARMVAADPGRVVGDWFGLAERYGAPLMRADSLDELIARLAAAGIPSAALSEEIERYNRACREGAADRLSPPRSDFRWPIERAPFYALRCVPGITATAGGIAIDAECRVLDASRNPLPGLYAAGVDAGGVFGRHYGGYLGWSLVSGRQAGRAAAAYSAGS